MYESMGCTLCEVARAGRVVEVEFDGVLYRVFNCSIHPDSTCLNCEPIGRVPVAKRPKAEKK